MYCSKFFVGIIAELYFTFIILSVTAEISYTLFLSSAIKSGGNALVLPANALVLPATTPVTNPSL